ncbi:MAG: hypothetical protein WDO56_02165 [Gammaproteobacteria bacterium]
MVVVTHAGDATVYNRRTTAAVRAVLVEIGQILASYRGKFAIVGGSVPWLLIPDRDMPHVGTMDVDIALDAEALGDGEYVRLVEALMKCGYRQGAELRRFQLIRAVPDAESNQPVEIVIDFLMPRDASFVRNVPPLMLDFAVQRASGAELALLFPQLIELDGRMPDGYRNRVQIAVASIPALLAMKGFALQFREKQKDAYDIYYCIRNYPGGIEAIAGACGLLLSHPAAREAYSYIANKFDSFDGYGPSRVRLFAESQGILSGRTADQWQRDAFGQVDSWLRAIGLRS